MKYEYTGTVKLVRDAKGNSAYNKREVVFSEFTPNGKEKTIPFVFFGDEKCNAVDALALNPGDRAKVSFFLGGHAWAERFYPDIDGFAIEKLAAAPAPSAPATAPASAPAAKTWADFIDAWKAERPSQANDKAAIQAFVGQVMPELINAAKLSGQRFVDIAASNPGTFERLIAAVRPPVVDNPSPSMSADDMPF